MSDVPANPKKIYGDRKVPLDLCPDVAMIHWAEAQRNGAEKYGAYNWRENHVEARTYVAAALRHLKSWAAGEMDASDSGVHHLGHVMACCAILMDAEAHGALIDNRVYSDAVLELLDHYEKSRTPKEHETFGLKSLTDEDQKALSKARDLEDSMTKKIRAAARKGSGENKTHRPKPEK